jgi:small subunit ribosomal protein S16
MVRIRLRRVGLKKQPSYRIVVTDRESPRDGRYIEIVGFYNPRTEPPQMEVKEDRVLHWLSVGAQPSEPVAHILEKTGTKARFDRMKKGEPVEALVAEAAAEIAARPPQSLKTRRVPPAGAPAESAPATES